MKKTIKIDDNVVGQRLDLALSILDNTISRSQIKKLIKSNEVFVNGNVEYRGNYKVRDGDIVEFTLDNQDRGEGIVPEKMDLDILYEDEDLLAINKPMGIVSHPATGHWTGTIMNGVVHRYNQLMEVGDKVRSGLIHRLDKDTSGVILVGKTNKGLWHYSKLFSQRKVRKKYLALIKGDFTEYIDYGQKLEQKNYIARHPGNRKKMAVVGEVDNKSLPADARISVTEFMLVTATDEYSLLSAFPKTGRTHQIRVHLANWNFPIVGDVVYGGESADRLMLHASEISLVNPSGELLKIKAPLPDKFEKKLEECSLQY